MADIEEAGLTNPRVILAQLIDRNADPDVLKKWVDLVLPLEDRAAEKLFNIDFKTAQSKMPMFVADANSAQSGKKYIRVESILEILLPIMTEHGFSVSWEPGIIVTPGTTRMRMLLSHVAGHTRPYEGDYAIDGEGAKGARFMGMAPGTVSGHTYGQRDMLRLAWGIIIIGKDNDGQSNFASEAEVKVINDMLDELQKFSKNEAQWQGFVVDFLKWLKVESLEQLPKRAFALAVNQLNKKRREKQEAKEVAK